MSDEEARAEEPMEMATAEGADDDYQMDAPKEEEPCEDAMGDDYEKMSEQGELDKAKIEGEYFIFTTFK